VVYPNQGVCRITGIEKKEIAGQKLELVRMEREEDGAAVLVPKGKVSTIGLRKVASGDQIEGVFHYLAAQYDDPELDWKVRHRDNADRLIAGGVLGVAEVVKGLHALSRIRPLPTKEREQYDNARHLLVHEVAVSLAVPAALAEDYIDYALMPPVGVSFKLKPPPKPVELPARPRRKVTRTDDEDLGLDDLGLDLGELPGAGAEPALGVEALAPEETAIPGIPSADEIPAPEVEGAALPEVEGEAYEEIPEPVPEEGEEGVDEEVEEPEVPPAPSVKKRPAARPAAHAPIRATEAVKPQRKRTPAKAPPAKAPPRKAPVKKTHKATVPTKAGAAAPARRTARAAAPPRTKKPAPRKATRGGKKK
jgi:CarD family transcriptional regulator